MHVRRLLAALGFAAALGCGTDRIVDPPGTAQLRVVNASREGTPIDLRIGGTLVLGGVGGSQSSDWATVPAGNAELVVSHVGTRTELARRSVVLNDGGRYTLLLSGSLSSLDPILASDTARIVAPNKVKIRVVHAAPNAQPLDVYLTTSGADLAGAFKLIDPFNYRSDTTDFPGYVERDPGVWQVRFTARGTLNVLVDTGPLDLAEGSLVSVVLSESSGGLVANVIDERAPRGAIDYVKVRLVHQAPGAPAVDARVFRTAGGDSLIFSTPFPQGMDSTYWLPVAGPGPFGYRVRFVASGTTTPLADSGPFNVALDQTRVVRLVNGAGGLEARVE